MIAFDHFGASAPAEDLYREFGITAERVVDAATDSLAAAHGVRQVATATR